MLENSLGITFAVPGVVDNTTSQLRQEYQACQDLLQAQPVSVRDHFSVQAVNLTESLVNSSVKLRYSFPDEITTYAADRGAQTIAVPQQLRSHMLGGWLKHVFRSDMPSALQIQLTQLEHSIDPAISTCAVLLRHALVMNMVHNYLPDGNKVQYYAEDDDEIPSLPVKKFGSAGATSIEKNARPITDTKLNDKPPDSLQSSNLEAASKFCFPQWVAFDEQNRLLVSDVKIAEDYILNMRRYLEVLDLAVGLAPYIVVDDEYETKCYGVMGQLINQGRALAHHQVEVICHKIECRSALHSLDRGFSLSVPYFNDQTMSIETYNFDVIPNGRVMFVPAFVVLAVRAEQLRIAQNVRLNLSTRRHLVKVLTTLERAFIN